MYALLIQAAESIPEYGISAGIAGLVLYFWRQDRKDRAEEKVADAKRYEAIATDFRRIVTDNTAAITSLKDALATRTIRCPYLEQQEAAQVAAEKR